MADFRKMQIDGAEALVGRTISGIRGKSLNGGTAIQRLTFVFDNGACLVADGSFPACAFMESPEDALRDIEEKRFDGVDCRISKPRDTRKGCWEADVLLTVTADGDEFTLHWKAVGRDDFDVSPEPRIHVRLPVRGDGIGT